LAQLFTVHEFPVEIFVSDAGSEDGTLAFLKKLKHPQLFVTAHGRKIGQAQSINQVLKRARGEYFCWLSDDNLLLPGTLEKACRILRRDSSIGMVGLKVRDVEGPFKEEAYIGGISPAGVLNVNQGVVRTAIARKVGGFCTRLKDYGIDPDFTTKVLLKGQRVVMTKDVQILHFRNWGGAFRMQHLSQAQKNYIKVYSRRYRDITRRYQVWKKRPRPAVCSVLEVAAKNIFQKSRKKEITRDFYNLRFGMFIQRLDPLKCLFRPYHFVQRIHAKDVEELSHKSVSENVQSPGVCTAIFGQLLAGRAGGIGTNLVELIRSLADTKNPSDRQLILGPGEESAWLKSICRAGQEVFPTSVIDPRQQFLAESLSGRGGWRTIRGIKRLWRSRQVWAQIAKQTEKTLRKKGIQVIHFPYQRFFPTKIPSLFEPWDLQHLHLPENFTAEEINFRNWLYPRGCYQASLVVTATFWTKRDLIRAYALPPEKIAVVYRGAPSFSQPQVTRLRKKNPAKALLNLRAPYLIYPAKTWPHKNHLRLIQALAFLRRQGQMIPLVCTGTLLEGSRETLQEALKSTGLEGSVYLVDHLSDEEFLCFLAQARAMIFPSLFEGLGIPVLEAMALGVPVACSRVACLPEVCGDAALLFDPLSEKEMARAIRLLWEDAGIRRTLRARGRQRAEYFSWRKAGKKFHILYKFLAGSELDSDETILLKSLFSEN